MNLEFKFPMMVFRREYEGKVYYNLGLSKKDQEGKYINGYIDCRFRKGVELEDKTKIQIKSGWLDFYKAKDNGTRVYVFVNEFEKVEGETKQPTNSEIVQAVMNDNDPFKEFANEVEVEGFELPF